MFIILGDQSKERESEKARKESEEYLMVNFPADVRKNLKGIILPQTKKTKEEKEKKPLVERQVESEGKVLFKETEKNEGNFSSGRDWRGLCGWASFPLLIFNNKRNTSLTSQLDIIYNNDNKIM